MRKMEAEDFDLDPNAHTLAGGTLAPTGLRRPQPLATAALILGAKPPGIERVMIFFC